MEVLPPRYTSAIEVQHPGVFLKFNIRYMLDSPVYFQVSKIRTERTKFDFLGPSFLACRRET